MLIDTHAHLDARHFSKDLPQVIERAAAAGVEKIIAIGCDVESSWNVLNIADQFPNVYATVGVHPCYVLDVTRADWLDQIRAAAAHPKCVAIGEIGLDYFHPPRTASWETYKTRQAEFFQAQMELAVELGKNIVVHQRNCFAEGVRQVAKFHGRLRAQFHCFTNSWADAALLIEHGHVISFTGMATYPKAADVLECATQAPLGTFMVETDAPYLTPQKFRGQRCEPAHVRQTAEAIADARGISLTELAASTTTLAREFFRLA